MSTNPDRREFIKTPTRVIAFSVITQFIGMNLLTTSELRSEEEDAECYQVQGVSIFKTHTSDADCTPQPSMPVSGADYNDNDCGRKIAAPGGRSTQAIISRIPTVKFNPAQPEFPLGKQVLMGTAGW